MPPSPPEPRRRLRLSLRILALVVVWAISSLLALVCLRFLDIFAHRLLFVMPGGEPWVVEPWPRFFANGSLEPWPMFFSEPWENAPTDFVGSEPLTSILAFGVVSAAVIRSIFLGRSGSSRWKALGSGLLVIATRLVLSLVVMTVQRWFVAPDLARQGEVMLVVQLEGDERWAPTLHPGGGPPPTIRGEVWPLEISYSAWMLQAARGRPPFAPVRWLHERRPICRDRCRFQNMRPGRYFLCLELSHRFTRYEREETPLTCRQVEVTASPAQQIVRVELEEPACHGSAVGPITLWTHGPCTPPAESLTSWNGRFIDSSEAAPGREQRLSVETLGQSQAPRSIGVGVERHLFAFGMPSLDGSYDGPWTLPEGDLALLGEGELHRVEVLDLRAALVRWKTSPLPGGWFEPRNELTRRVAEGHLVHFGKVEGPRAQWLPSLFELRLDSEEPAWRQLEPAWRQLELEGEAPADGGSWLRASKMAWVFPFRSEEQLLVVQAERPPSRASRLISEYWGISSGVHDDIEASHAWAGRGLQGHPRAFMAVDSWGIWMADLVEGRWREVMRGASVDFAEPAYAVDPNTGSGLLLTNHARPVDAVRLGDGRILASREVFSLWSPEDRTWRPLGVTPPVSSAVDHSLDILPGSGKVLLFGGADLWRTRTTNTLWELDPSEPSIRQIGLAEPPPARAGHASAISRGKLVIVGGLASRNPVVQRRDVWIIDLERREARHLVDLSVGRQEASLWLRGDEIWVIGGWDWQDGRRFQESIDAVNTETGDLRSIATEGPWPSQQWTRTVTLDGAPLAIDLRGLYGETRVWRLETSGEGARWVEGVVCLPGITLASSIDIPGERALLVGDCVQELTVTNEEPEPLIDTPGPTPEAEEPLRPIRREEPSGGTPISDQEIDELISEFERRFRAGRSRRCDRPVLRGQPIPGPAQEDQLALMDSSGELRACYELIARAGSEIGEAMSSWDGWRVPLAMDDERAQAEVIAQAEGACEPVVQSLRRAVSHDDGCSPYLPSRRRFTEGQISPIRVTRAASIMARRSLREDRLPESAEISLNALRYCQDFGRGEAEFLVGLLSIIAAEPPSQTLELILNDPAPLPDPLLDQIDSELAALLASEPHPSQLLRGTRLDISLAVVRGVLPDLVPPELAPEDLLFGSLIADVTPRQAAGLALSALGELDRRLMAACPEQSRFAACAGGLRGLTREALPLPGPEADQRSRDVRAELVGVLEGEALPAYSRYLERYAGRAFRLAALRLHTALRAQIQHGGRCLRPEELTGEAWTPYLTDPVSGEQMIVVASEPGLLVLAPPWIPEDLEAQETHHPHLVRCP